MGYHVSIWSGYYSELPFEQILDRFASAGFDHAELCTSCLLKLMEQEGAPEQIGIRTGNIVKDKGFKIPQGHLSFKKGLVDPTAIDNLQRELDLFSGMGITNAVIHANGGKELPAEERFEKRVYALSVLAEYLKGTSIKLCLENLGSVPETHTVERIRKIIDAVDSDRLGICLDTGHLHLVNGRGEATQSQREFILGAGKDLCAMHITNNSGMGDDHLMPFSSREGIEWKEVMIALKGIDYQGLFNLEILGEKNAPLFIRDEKLKYVKTMTDYLISDEFLNT